MNISSYGVAGAISGYGTQYIPQTSSKPFTIPIWGEDIGKTNNATQKTENNDKTNPFETGTFNYQDWLKSNTYDGGMYTKTETARSDEEILKDMAELAKKHAQQGNFNGFGDEEFQTYFKEYISSVSPDREGILNRAVNEVIARTNQGEDYSMYSAFQQMDPQRTDKKEAEKEPIDYLIELLKNKGKGKINDNVMSKINDNITNMAMLGNMNIEDIDITKNGNYYLFEIDNGGGMKTSLTYDINGDFQAWGMLGNNYSVSGDSYGATTNATFKDDNGEIIASYSQHGFYSSTTSAEVERRKEILAVYNETFREYKAYA